MTKNRKIIIRFGIIAIVIVSVCMIIGFLLKDPVGFPNDNISFKMSPIELRLILGKEIDYVQYKEWGEERYDYIEEIDGHNWNTSYTFFATGLNKVTAALKELDDNEGRALFEKYYKELNDFYKVKPHYMHNSYEDKFEEEKIMSASFGTSGNAGIGVTVNIDYKNNSLYISLYDFY